MPTDMRVAPVSYLPGIADFIASGQSTIERADSISNSGATGNQALRLSYFTSRISALTGNVRMNSGGTAAAPTPTLVRMGLYTIATNGDGTLVASIPSDTALFAAAATAYTRAWSVAYQQVFGQRYAFGLLVVTAAAAPTVQGAQADVNESTIAPRLTGQITAQADLPSTFTGVSVSVSGVRHYAALLP